MPGLVPEEKHSGCAADAAAQDHCQKQGLFRDAPQVLFGTLLVDAPSNGLKYLVIVLLNFLNLGNPH